MGEAGIENPTVPSPSPLISIIDQLHFFPSSMTLRLVSTYFHNLLKPLGYQEMLTIEKSDYTIFHDVLACHECKRLRPGHTFNESQRHVFVPGCQHREERTCIECNARVFYDDLGQSLEVSTSELESWTTIGNQGDCGDEGLF